ncbi:MAG TPA: CaiB/BaiF CoA-transferase family protein [Casimicrobiaceae bacterium]|nr:CaiB/BaiF CoA-transferase family protein [Casimicrobiaceae bacterium]
MKPESSPASAPPVKGWQPLAGVRVLDFSLLLPGPFATVILADLGADVAKIEPPDGDFARQMPVAMFRMANRNKRSITLDLKHPHAAGVVERLARWADVAIEGFRPGVADRLGIGHAALTRHNPRIVYCSLSGYGQDGPACMAPGHDLNYLAAAGALVLPGHWSEPPRRSGLPVADLAGGSYAAIAILSALHERSVTGKGVYLDLSLAEAALSFTQLRHGLDLDEPTRTHLYPTNDLFETSDGQAIALGIVEQHFWEGFVAAASDLAPDLHHPRFADEPKRRTHGDALARRLREVMRQRSAADWLARFEEHDVPAQLALTPARASRSDQMTAREMVMELNGERHVPFPVRTDGRRGAALHATAPGLGADTDTFLAELGFTNSELGRLRAAGVFGSAGSVNQEAKKEREE